MEEIEFQRVLINILNDQTKLLKLLVKASEINLVDLKYDSDLLTLQFATSATAIPDPENTTPSNGGYTVINIYDILQRSSPELYIQNEGPGVIRLRIKRHSGEISQSENVVYEGETKEFYDVHDIRLRTTTVNTHYRLTEFKPEKHRDFVYKTGLSYVSETTVAVSGTPNIESVVTDPVKGLGRFATTGYLANDGPGNILLNVSIDGTKDGTTITIFPNEYEEFEEELYSLKIDATQNATAYRLNVH